MKQILIIVAIVLAIIFFALGIRNWDRIMAFFSGKPASDKSGFDRCIESNKSKADGEACGNCIPEGSGQPSFAGTIRNGVCERTQDSTPAPTYSNRIQITKAGGTRTFTKDSGGNIVSPQSANFIPQGTVLQVTELVTSPAPYYNTIYGWIDANDATVVA